MESIENINRMAGAIRRKSKALVAFSALTLLASISATNLYAQTFSEWFAQKKTQKKYLLQQIAALQVYSGYLRDGYGIARNGLGSISNSLRKEFDLHNSFYQNLNTINPLVKDNRQVKEIITWQSEILRQASKLDNLAFVTPEEQNYLNQVKHYIINDCNIQITALSDLVVNGRLNMSDEERLQGIAIIHSGMESAHQFICHFNGELKLFLSGRKNGTGEAGILNLYTK